MLAYNKKRSDFWRLSRSITKARPSQNHAFFTIASEDKSERKQYWYVKRAKTTTYGLQRALQTIVESTSYWVTFCSPFFAYQMPSRIKSIALFWNPQLNFTAHMFINYNLCLNLLVQTQFFRMFFQKQSKIALGKNTLMLL